MQEVELKFPVPLLLKLTVLPLDGCPIDPFPIVAVQLVALFKRTGEGLQLTMKV
jgi:hypothetical protein